LKKNVILVYWSHVVVSVFYFIYFCLAEALGHRAETFIQIICTVSQKDFPIALRAFVFCHLRVDCSPLLFHLQLLFQVSLLCSVVPDSFGKVNSILKHGKDPCPFSSYHPLTVSCNLSKDKNNSPA
jgi:hypothetical protein